MHTSLAVSQSNFTNFRSTVTSFLFAWNKDTRRQRMLLTLQFVSPGQNRSRLNASRVSHRIPSIHNWYALTWRCRGARLIQCNINDQRHTVPFNYTRSATLYFLHARFSIPCPRRSPDPVPLVPSIRHQFHNRNAHLMRSSCKGDVPWWRPRFAAISTRACDHVTTTPRDSWPWLSSIASAATRHRHGDLSRSNVPFHLLEPIRLVDFCHCSAGIRDALIVLSYVEWNTCEFWHCSF